MEEDNKKSLASWLQDGDTLSGKLSEIVRSLAIALIGIVWIFKIEKKDSFHLLPDELILPLIYIGWALFLDLMQYLYSALLAYGTYLYYEISFNFGKKNELDLEDITINGWWTVPTYLTFFSKIGLTLTGYLYLFGYLLDKL